MLDFINNNGVLFGGICSIITALIAAIVALVIDSRKNKKDTIASMKKEINSLKEELDRTKTELNEYKSIEHQEISIDKTHGSIYLETLPNGGQRKICGYCWENKHKKMPLVLDTYYSSTENRIVTTGDCGSCKTTCYKEK